MRRRFASNIALAVLFALLTAHAGEALEPVDLFPQTTFSVALLVRPPPGNAFTNTLRYEDDSGNFHLDTRSYNYTPPYTDLVNVSVGRVIPPQLPVTWNVTAAMGVQVNAGGWNNAACLLGDISKYSAFYGFSTCSDKLQGIEGPGLSFGAAGAPLLKSFEVSAANDAVGFGASLDNIGVTSAQNAGAGISATLRDGVRFIGGVLSALGGALAETGAGAVIAGLGFLATNIGAELTVVNDINQANSVTAQQNCLGGLLGNPPQGSKNPLDAIMTQTTAAQLYEGTQTSPLYLTVATLMNYPPANPPWAFGACQAATNIVFIIDRPRNPNTFAWTNGLAFQPRAADSAVVRRRNAVESFRVDPVHRRIEHDSWRYSPFQDSLDSSNPSVGLALCNRPQSCSPHAWAEPVGGYIAGALDPSGQHPPAVTNRATPLTALSPEPSQLVLFFVDDMGGLYISAASYGASDIPTWRTWLLEAGQPPNAPVAALRGYPEPDQYTLFWVGTDGSVRMAVLYNNETQPRSAVTVSTISGSIAAPGAAIAALQRTPWLQEVFVVGAGTLWQLTGMGGPWTGSPWNVAQVGPSSGQVVTNGPVSAVATDATSVDLFYINRSQMVQHLSRASGDADWSFDRNLQPVLAAAGTRQLSAVSRAPNTIDIVVPCDGAGLCNISIPSPSQTPAISPLGATPDGPLSIVAARSEALDVISGSDAIPGSGGNAGSDGNAFDVSWQTGAQSWATTAPLAACDDNTCWSFAMSVAPTSVSIAANDSVSVFLTTVMLNSSTPIALTVDPPPGVVAGQSNPTSVVPGQGVYLGFAVPLGTSPGARGPITIIGNNGIETHSVTVDVASTQCVPLTCSADTQCGQLDDNCGHILQCGQCGRGQACYLGTCVPARCTHPRSCPRGFYWDVIDCACDPL